MVRQVEALRAELQVFSFANLEILADREIDLSDARTDQGIPPQVAERAERLRREGARVKVESGRPNRSSRGYPRASARDAAGRIGACSRREIRPVGEACARQLVLRTVGRVLDRERNATRKL